jgi:hypothetical protein
MPQPNAKTLSNAASSDLGLTGGGDVSALSDEDEKRKKLLQAQRERMGITGMSVFGQASTEILGGLGG